MAVLLIVHFSFALMAPGATISNVIILLSLIVVGLLFTNTMFTEIHHPLRCYQYLTLPCSNVEKYFSRYLISGPFFLIYAVFSNWAFQVAEPFFRFIFFGYFAGFETPCDFPFYELLGLYMMVHACVLFGAVFFRSYSLPRMVLAICLLLFSLICTMILSLKIFYSNYFDSAFSLNIDVERMVRLLEHLLSEIDTYSYIVFSGLICVYLYVVYLGYIAFKDHEI